MRFEIRRRVVVDVLAEEVEGYRQPVRFECSRHGERRLLVEAPKVTPGMAEGERAKRPRCEDDLLHAVAGRELKGRPTSNSPCDTHARILDESWAWVQDSARGCRTSA